MPFVRPDVAVGRLLLPLLLLVVCCLALGGLMALSPASGPATVDVVAYQESPLVPKQAQAQRELRLERDAARASRSRVQAEAEAAERAAAEAAAAAAAQAAAAAAAQAQAEAEREAAGACPVPAASFTDTFGAARSGGRSHQGTDLLAPLGTPVYAVVSGRVRTDTSSLGGLSLYLDGDNGETYFYAHNSANVASNGERVEAGELVAKVGSTGNAGGTNHVHFERQVGGRSVNPFDFLRRLC